MAAAAVSTGSTGSTTNASSGVLGSGPQRAYSLPQEPAFAGSSNAKQQQAAAAVFHGHLPHMQQQNQQHPYGQPESINSATSPASAGPSYIHASAPSSGLHPAASAPGSAPIPQSSSFPTSASSHRVAGSASSSGTSGVQATATHTSNEQDMMHKGPDTVSSTVQGSTDPGVTAPFPPAYSSLNPAQYGNTSNNANNNANSQYTQPAFSTRTASPLSYAVQGLPSTSTAPIPSASTSIPMTAKTGVQHVPPSEQTFAEKVELFSSVSVSDHRHLFHAYIYDYLFRQGYERTARAFLQDAPNVPTKQKKDRKGKQQGGSVSHTSSRNSRNKRKRSENEDDDILEGDKQEGAEANQGEGSSRAKKRPTSQTSLSNMPESIAEEQGDSNGDNGLKLNGMKTLNQDGKPSTSSSEDSNSTASSSHFFGSSTKDSSSNASLSTQATTATGISMQTGIESHAATKGSDAGTTGSTADENDTMINSTNSPLGSRDNLFSPSLFSPNQSPDKSELNLKDNITDQEDEEDDLPLPDIQIDSHWGFLYEWWEVFWDVWRAKGAKGAGSLAAKAYEKTLHDFVSFLPSSLQGICHMYKHADRATLS